MTRTTPQEDHPSAARRRTRPAVLFYGLIAAPSAWILAQMFCSNIASQACHPKYEALATPAITGVPLAHAIALGLAGMICASGAFVAYGAWARTRGEHHGGSQTLLEVGEGRSRFMALVGLLTSLGFLLAVGFSVPALLLVPLC